MYNFKYLVAGAALALATSAAVAGGPEQAPPAPVDNSGFYINANGGLALLASSDPYKTTGWNGGLALGYHWNAFRLELAGSYIQNNARNEYRNVLIATSAGGGYFNFSNLKLWNVMANGLYDFDFGGSFIPYVGIGLGWINGSAGFSVYNNTNIPDSFRFKASQNSFAFQGILGLDYKITDNVRAGITYHALGWTHRNRWSNWDSTNDRIFVNGPVTNNNSFENLINLSLSYYF